MRGSIPLGYLSSAPVVNGLGLAGANDDPAWPRYIRTTDIASPTALRDDVFASQPPDIANQARVQAGDLLMTAAGTIGKSTRLGDIGPACFAGFLVRFRPNARTEGRYIGYWMQSQHYWDQIAVGAVRSTIDNFSASKYRRLRVPMWSLTEQRAIADYLDRKTAKIDTLIEKQTTMIERLRERRVGLVVATVARGLNADVPKQAGPGWAGEVPAPWRVLPLKRVLASVQTGTWGAEADGGDDDITCVRVADFDRPRLAVGESDTLRSVSAPDRRRLGLRRGDLLIEKSGGTAINPVGFVAIYDTDHAAVCANFIGRMRFRPGQASRFWLYALHGSYASGLTWRHVKQTTGIQNLDLDSFVAEQFPVPPLAEQREIADYLDRETAKIDTLIAKVERHIELARERRAALITAAVTGQIDVTTSTQSGDAA
ncbi:restriction endonuclease subunit S [Dermacoccus sp. CCH2-D9]|uniref:restriction endonuclease subunit S n=1 Tax=Dermacoccus sp. CCH2-D9 TaxID=1768779 RepID=UPI0009E9D83D|nr:restriction endonuclease subunit S [Dermacoccus sp. CCH2-D9]